MVGRMFPDVAHDYCRTRIRKYLKKHAMLEGSNKYQAAYEDAVEEFLSSKGYDIWAKALRPILVEYGFK